MKGITALGNEEINKQLKKELEIIGKDIQYQEAVLDVLENNENIEFLVLSSIIPGQFNIYEFINLIISLSFLFLISILLKLLKIVIGQYSKELYFFFLVSKQSISIDINTV